MTLDIPGTPEKNPKETKKSGNSRDSAFNTFHTRTQTQHVPPSTQELQLNMKSERGKKCLTPGVHPCTTHTHQQENALSQGLKGKRLVLFN